MERIKKSKYFLSPIIISVILFFIPFFWLKPGEMDLGGDSTRLYFYDPVSFKIGASITVLSLVVVTLFAAISILRASLRKK